MGISGHQHILGCSVATFLAFVGCRAAIFLPLSQKKVPTFPGVFWIPPAFQVNSDLLVHDPSGQGRRFQHPWPMWLLRPYLQAIELLWARVALQVVLGKDPISVVKASVSISVEDLGPT